MKDIISIKVLTILEERKKSKQSIRIKFLKTIFRFMSS
jgi:hypothetical protein